MTSPLLLSAALLASVPAVHAAGTWTGPGPGYGSTTGASPGLPASAKPGPLQEVGYDQKLGGQVPLDLAFRDEAGRAVRLGDYLGQRPVILVLAYYHCPMLCDMVLNATASSLRTIAFDAGRQFDVVVASIDPKETAAQAQTAKAKALDRYGRKDGSGWHFLTGAQPSITALAKSVGFRYTYDQERDQFAHAAGIVFLTPDGRVSRYLFGIEYPPRDVRLALVESADRKIGTLVDQALLYCFHYDPATGRYSAMTFNILRIAGVLTVLGLVLMITLLRRRETHEPGPLGAA